MNNIILKNLQLNTIEQNCDLFIEVDFVHEINSLINSFSVTGRKNIFIFPHFLSEYTEKLKTIYNRIPDKDITLTTTELLFSEFENIDFLDKYEIIIPWAECAILTEYGYKKTYEWINEYRASTSNNFHVTALISAGFEEAEKLKNVYGSKDALFINMSTSPVFRAAKFNSKRSLYKYSKDECLKSVSRKIAFVFSTRREMLEFSKIIKANGIMFRMISGATSFKENYEIINEFKNNITNILLLTKSAIYISAIIKIDKVIYCGMPYTKSHISRCAMLSENNNIDIFFSDEDYFVNKKIIISNAQFFDEYIRDDYISGRMDKLKYVADALYKECI